MGEQCPVCGAVKGAIASFDVAAEPTPPRNLWSEWRRLIAEGVQVTSELEHDNHTTFILCVVGFDADDQAEYRGSHADPEQAFRLALAAVEEQDK